MYGNMILAQNVNADQNGNGFFINNPTNSFSVLSTPTLHNLALLFNISGIDPKQSHNLKLVLRSESIERIVLNENIPVQINNFNSQDDDPNTVFSMNANIVLNSLQIDHLGRFDLILYVDDNEICSSPLVFTQAKALQ
ncbi:DUF6941 family protein [Enterococcus casseliflavus]|jgi:hypothetical protein|uniref:DUF6941 family protein n=1 Tax=Enterococcus casseliflavus TaxID=37734 RepID=UPI000763C152|nr:hypothetical protein [Enterococcus casseliflavus]OJG29546.1 hypothetical protein RU99_GL001232 [Enterococcus casseliflavus]QQU21715.1 hypothetical protein I6I77_09275 [Enterococcus casseliflavus]STQ31557.1 Uncharacterised protein [Enterococcus casseliflavus]